MISVLREPLDHEQREGIRVLVATRWVLIAAAFFVVDYRHGTSTADWIALNGLLGVALVLNGILQLALLRAQTIPMALPLLAGAYDIAGMTAAIALVDGFDNVSHMFYYPALMGFSLAFPGRLSLVYGVSAMGAYSLIVWMKPETFDPDLTGDQKALVLRLTTMGATVMAANIVMKIERARRIRAVASERERQMEFNALEERAREMERTADQERHRLLRDVHDGVAQGVYMLSMGIESARTNLAQGGERDAAITRLGLLEQVAKQTLLETRGLLYDLHRVMAGESSFAALVRNQGREFQAITGIHVAITVVGTERPMPPTFVSEIYRVLQEALANVYKHASAREVIISINFEPQGLALEIADDGQGFDLATTDEDSGHGLRTMVERTRELGGRFAVESHPGRGARLHIDIPWGTS